MYYILFLKWVLTVLILNDIMCVKVIGMQENQQILYTYLNKIVFNLQNMLAQIEAVRLHYLVKNNVQFQFDATKNKLVIGIKKTPLTPSEYRELVARLARIKKICKGFNNLLFVFQNQLSKSNDDEKEVALILLTKALDDFMLQKRKTVVEAMRKHGKFIEENFDIDSLESNVITTKTSLLVLRDVQTYYYKQLEDVKTNLF